MKNTQGKVFGPIGLDDLRKWVMEGRVEPLAGISTDLKNWMLAPLKPELEMNWVVENNPGQFYGPTHRAVIDDLIESGALSADARFYQDDRGASAKQVADAAESVAEASAVADKAKAETAVAQKAAEQAQAAAEEANGKAKAALAERDAALATAAAAEKARDAAEEAKAAAETRAAELESTVAAQKKEIDELNGRLAKIGEVHAREWKVSGEVLEPEIVSDAPPPSVARSVFAKPAQPAAAAPTAIQGNSPFAGAGGNAAAMAALEAQARRELARMGASGAKKFFRFKK